MKLRRFNPDGLNTFRELLALCRRQPDTEIPVGLLENATLTEVVAPETQIAAAPFETKGDAARYLASVLRPLAEEDLLYDAGMWSWLSLLFFDSVCPIENGNRVVKNDYHYIFAPKNTRHFYRHLLFVSWRVLKLAPTHNRLFLRARLNILDQITERVMSRLFFTRIPCIFEVLDRLYWDEKKGHPRKGITDMKVRAGNLRHRLPIRIHHLEKTYDLMSLDANQLIELLGKEFAFARPQTRRLFQTELAE